MNPEEFDNAARIISTLQAELLDAQNRLASAEMQRLCKRLAGELRRLQAELENSVLESREEQDQDQA